MVAFWPRNSKTAVLMSPVADGAGTKQWSLCQMEFDVSRKEAPSAEKCVGWKVLSVESSGGYPTAR